MVLKESHPLFCIFGIGQFLTFYLKGKGGGTGKRLFPFVEFLSGPSLFFFEGIINRARPQQINRKLDVLASKTASTPSYPSGHAFQAYYLAQVLSSRYPEKAEMFSKIAEDCALARVYAGLHYPSDNEFSKTLVETFF